MLLSVDDAPPSLYCQVERNSAVLNDDDLLHLSAINNVFGWESTESSSVWRLLEVIASLLLFTLRGVRRF